MLDNQLFAEINPQQEAAVSGGHGGHGGHGYVYRPAIPCHKDRDPRKAYPAISCQQSRYTFDGKENMFAKAY